MKLQKVQIAELSPHPMNYNTHPEAQLVELEKSLESFQQFKNIVVCQNTILAGHGLVQAAKRKGLTELDAVVMDNMTDEQQKALLIADNALPFLAVPDSVMLQELLDDLGDYEIPGVNDDWMESFSSGESDIDFDDDTEGFDDTYTKKIQAPVYEPKNEKPDVSELYDTDKSDMFSKEIQSLTIPKEEKEFLLAASRRHVVFNYQKIADYYAHSSADIQDLMEKSALVIIDFEKAIENGYVRLSKEIAEQYLEEHPDND